MKKANFRSRKAVRRVVEATTIELLENRQLLSTVLYRLDAGGAALGGVPGWGADTAAAPSTYVNATASGNHTFAVTNAIDMTDPSVPPGTPQALFQSERYNDTTAGNSDLHYAFPVTAGGNYTVRLYFAETYFTAAGQRVFGANIDGTNVLSNFDAFAAVGANKAIVKSFTVTDPNNSLTVDLIHSIENPSIKGIEVIKNDTGPGVLGASESALSFSNTAANSGTAVHQLTLTNFGAAGSPSITISGVLISGAQAGMFTTNFGGSSVILAPGQTTTFNVTYAPTISSGAVAATLTVNSSAASGALSIPLAAYQVPPNTGVTPVGFGKSALNLNGGSLANPTSLQWGPDGKLYVAQQNGVIKVLTVSRTAQNNYIVTNTQTITAVQQITNHDDNGTVNSSVTTRLVTGLLVVGTAANPILYVSSSDPRIGGASAQGGSSITNADTNSGVISRLTWNGSSWTMLNLVRGLPRSENDHVPNGLQYNASTNTLFLSIAGNTNEGAPSADFNLLPEYALSAAVLSINLTAIGNTTYDIPTLSDPSIPTGVFGGDFGKHQARLIAGGPVQVYAAGFRNPYDIVIASNGYLYTIDNGPNAGWGDVPLFVNGHVTNNQSEPGNTYQDQLHVITGSGGYFGHPDPVRSDSTVTYNGQSPVDASLIDPRQSNFEIPGPANGAMTLFPYSTDGITQYSASNFGGALKNDLLAASYGGNLIADLKLSADGMSVVSNTALFSNVGAATLDVTAVGDGGVDGAGSFAGSIWAADYALGKIFVFEPNDYAGNAQTVASGRDDSNLDEDTDTYSNHDEILNGTNPASSADAPHDWNHNGISDLLDPDDDGDGIADPKDPFAVDPNNGKTTNTPINYDWNNEGAGSGTGFLLNLGITGLMSDGVHSYDQLYDPTGLTAGGAAGAITIDQVGSGDALTNTQQYGFQFGFNATQNSTPFVLHTRLLAPFAGETPTAHQSQGFYFGTGDQNNYSKVVITGAGKVEFLQEVNGVVTSDQLISAPSVLNADYVDLFLAVNPANDQIVASYTSTSNSVTSAQTTVNSAVAFPSSWLSNAVTAPAVGLISSCGTDSTFTATWDFVYITGGTAVPVESPYGGTAPTAPTTIEAENFDNGGEGLAYHDTSTNDEAGLWGDTAGAAYRPTEGVDVETSTDTGGGFNVGYIHTGEYMKYTFNVTAGGNYIISPRLAAVGTGGMFHIEVDGVTVGASTAAPNTGAWQTYQNVDMPSVNLTAGTHVLKFVADAEGSSGFVTNINNIQIRTAPVVVNPIVMDNTSTGVTLTGAWTLKTGQTGALNGDYLHDQATGKGSKSVTYKPTITTAGQYQVYAWWQASSIRATNVPYDIVSAAGTTTVSVNQQANGGKWVLLGTFNFAAGTSGFVKIRNTGTAAGTYVCADGVEFVPVTATTTIVMVTPTAGQTFSAGSSITLSSKVTPAAGTTISKVDFLQGTTVVGTATAVDGNGNYTVTWANVVAGSYSITARATTSTSTTFTSSAVAITVSAVSTPFSGTPITMPGQIEAENFDNGGEGIAYHDSDTTNQGGVYRTTGVDIEASTDTGGGYNVGNTKVGEWMNYTIKVATAGTYTIKARVAADAGYGGTFHYTINGVNSNTITFPTTGGWQTWQTVSSSPMTLAAGTYILRITFDSAVSGGDIGNLNWISLS